jgi:hypothetical protein
MPSQNKAGAAIERARIKAAKVRDDLHVAGGELALSNTILERKLPPAQKSGDVGKALAQNEGVVRKVFDARDELREVEDLLHREEAELKRLERELAARRGAT